MMRARKGLILSTVVFLLILGIAGPVAAQNWVTLNDEFSIDYENTTLKLFITYTYSGNDRIIKGKASAKMHEFIANLNMEDSDKKMKTVLSARPMLDAKIKAGISDHLKYIGSSVIEQDKLFLLTFTLNLKAIKEIAPEIELPRSSN